MRSRLSPRAAAFVPVAGDRDCAECRASPSKVFTAADVFRLESAANPQISPGWKAGRLCARLGRHHDDRFRRSIWVVDETGANHWPLAQGKGNYSSPVWSPDGKTVAYAADEDGAAEVRIFDLASRRSATLARLPAGAGNLAWSPDGRTLAFESFVKEAPAERRAAAAQAGRRASGQSPRRSTTRSTTAPMAAALSISASRRSSCCLPMAARRASSPFRPATMMAASAGPRMARRCCSPPMRRRTGSTIRRTPISIRSMSRAARSRASPRATGRTTAPVMSPNGKLIAYTGFDDKLHQLSGHGPLRRQCRWLQSARADAAISTATSPTRNGPAMARSGSSTKTRATPTLRGSRRLAARSRPLRAISSARPLIARTPAATSR